MTLCVLFSREDRKVQLDQEGMETDQIDCHEGPTRTCFLQERSGWGCPRNPVLVVNSIVATA
jgi:hypothetical protein